MSKPAEIKYLTNAQIDFLILLSMGYELVDIKSLAAKKLNSNLVKYGGINSQRHKSNDYTDGWFSPTEDWEHCGILLDNHTFSLNKHGTKWVAIHSTNYGVHIGVHSNLQRAICLSRLHAFYGPTTTVFVSHK